MIYAISLIVTLLLGFAVGQRATQRKLLKIKNEIRTLELDIHGHAKRVGVISKADIALVLARIRNKI